MSLHRRLPGRVWIDVGAHLGQYTLDAARQDGDLTVFAFEPNLEVAARRMGLLPNFVVIPMAVAEEDGCAEFHVTSLEAASSLLPFDPKMFHRWRWPARIEVERTVTVPTVRLDTFMDRVGIDRVEFLKVDAQGMDLAVVRSAGARLADIDRVTLEVQVTPEPLYAGAATKDETVRFLEEQGFALVEAEPQSYAQEENLTFVRPP